MLKFGPVTMTLEALIFEDGSSAEGDSTNSVRKIKAMTKAEYDLYKQVLSRAAGTPSDVRTWLRSLAAQYPPGSNLRLGTDPFDGWYAYYQLHAAARLLDLAARLRIGGMVKFVRSAIGTKPYPSLMVNE